MKKVIHVDMDYFFAQVEELDKPWLKNVPFAIGGEDGRRGVLCTSNYIAREYGVKSAMPNGFAKKLCPHLVIVTPEFSKYSVISDQIFEIFLRYTEKVQKVSIDEAYLDVTDSKLFKGNAIDIAKNIKESILRETGLTCSAGVSFNKLLAKIGSDLFKPNGLAILRPENIERNIAHFPISYLRGVGKVTQVKMENLGLYNFGDVQKKNKLFLLNHFGSFGSTIYNFSRGIDNRELELGRVRKSLSVEHTFREDLDDELLLGSKLLNCFEDMKKRLAKHSHRSIKNIFVKIKYADFSSVTIERPLQVDFENFKMLFDFKIEEKFSPIRLLGTGVRFYTKELSGQLEFEFI